MDQMPSQARMPALVYDGRLGELYGMFLKNILFTILTLGIWRFWAITRYRRYFWSRMRFSGERFEYTGTGGELFVGYLLAGLVLIGGTVVAVALGYGLSQIWQPLLILPIIVWYLCIFVLAAGAIFSAQRYRLTRTQWCGVRGGMVGSMLTYGVHVVLYMALAAITLWQMLPWAQIRLAERRINASSFGAARFSFNGRAGQVYMLFLLTLIANVVLFAVIAGVAWGIVQSTLTEGGPEGLLMQMASAPAFPYVVFGGAVVFAILSALLSCWYLAMFQRHVLGNTALAGMQFSSSITGRALFGLVAGNVLILLFTLGLGYPILLHRNAAFLARTLRVSGPLDPAALGQNLTAAPRFGEGMYQQLDAGGIF